MKSKNHDYLFFCPNCGVKLDEQTRDSSGVGLPTRSLECECGWCGKDADCVIKRV